MKWRGAAKDKLKPHKRTHSTHHPSTLALCNSSAVILSPRIFCMVCTTVNPRLSLPPGTLYLVICGRGWGASEQLVVQQQQENSNNQTEAHRPNPFPGLRAHLKRRQNFVTQHRRERFKVLQEFCTNPNSANAVNRGRQRPTACFFAAPDTRTHMQLTFTRVQATGWCSCCARPCTCSGTSGRRSGGHRGSGTSAVLCETATNKHHRSDAHTHNI